MSFSGTKGYLTKPKPGVMLNPLHPLSRGLVGCWLFNEGTGSLANDISRYGNHGQLTNMAPNIQGSGWGGSKFGGGLNFDGGDDYVDCGDDSSITNLNVGTAMGWMYLDTLATSIIIGYGGGNTAVPGTFGFGIRQHTNYYIGTTSQIEGSAGWDEFRGSTQLSAGTWYHLTMTSNGSYCRLYVNGVEETIVITQGSNSGRWFGDVNPAETDMVTIGGAMYDGSMVDLPDGKIDHVCIYNRTLSEAEINQLYHNPFCNLLQVPIRRYSVIAPSVGAIMNQFQRANIGADLYNGVFA